MKILKTEIDGVRIIEPKFFGDHRGGFMETYQRQRYAEHGIAVDFVQDNFSFSRRGTLRGLHFQQPHGQAKLVQVFQGEVFDVAVDIRLGSPTFGRWTGAVLSEQNRRQMFVPEGFAHGFCVLSETAQFTYKCSDYYAPECEAGIRWSDPALAITWPIRDVVLSEKDANLPLLQDMPLERLPSYRKLGIS